MKNFIKIAGLILLFPIVVHGQSELAKYQRKVKGTIALLKKADADKLVQVTLNSGTEATAYGGPSSALSTRNIYSLSEKGQKELIAALNTKTTTTKDFLQALPTVLEPSKEAVSNIEIKQTDFLKKLELDINNLKSAQNSGRITQLMLRIQLTNTNDIELEGFNNLSSKYQSVDFGTLSLNKVHGFTLNAGVNLGGTGATTSNVVDVNGGTTDTNTNGSTTSNTSNLGASYTSTRTIAEQIAIKNNVLTMKGFVGSNEATLLLNGVPNQDLNDNVNLELIFKTVNNTSVPRLTFKGIFDANNAPVTTAANLTLTKGYFTIPVKLQNDVQATLSYTFVYRDVVSGQNTVVESDDKIYLDVLNNPALTSTSFTILKAAEIQPRLYQIASFSDSVVPKSPDGLYLNYYGEHIQLLFSDLNAAADIVTWLRLTGQTQIKGFNFEIGTLTAAGMTYSNFASNPASLSKLKSIIY